MRGRVVAGLGLLVACVVSVCRIVEHDTPWYVASGQLVWRTRSLPALDPFSYTSSRPWLNHEWLSELVLAAAHRVGGFAMLSIVQGLAVAATLVLALRLPRHVLGWIAAALVTFVLREAASPRAQLLSLVLFAATLRLVLDDEPGARRLWWCVPIQLVWTQLHGGNPVGVAAVGLLFASGPSLRRGLVAGGCALATIVGPYGWSVHAHFLGARQALPMIREWEPLWHALYAGAPSQWVAVVSVLVAVVTVALRPRLLHVLLLVVFSIVAVRYVRFSVEAALVAAAISTRSMEGSTRPLYLPLPLLLLAGLASLGQRTLGLGLEPDRFPVAAVEWLRVHEPPGPMLNSYNFGGYLLWAWPEQKVFVDGRAFTVYDDAIVSALPAVYDDPTRFDALDARFRFRLAVLQRRGRGAAFAEWLRMQPGWQVAYEDAVTRVLVRMLR